MKSDVIVLLHELMHKPKGKMKLSEMRRAQSFMITAEPRVLLLYCAQKSFINLEQGTVQLTDEGLDYYLANSKLLT
ncbi:hypothetical protein DDN80_02865 [Vibrio cholerae]|uniref:Transcriptional regulator n=1 Tax=Vibrio diazotrophicus TaxID=685 RepID=A0ABX4W464_VIBDI|nr:hypothetical protein [Vibrio cholerae]PNH83417.1 hypothetical protein C1N27_02235 [Vibrio diazotrophicus]PNH93710.1 hypothetical protein C1O24_18855 [Vibrio diazotrophicus]PNH96535.1 hypothetical protein C1O25_21440 [Vibrio diazotrophicus]